MARRMGREQLLGIARGMTGKRGASSGPPDDDDEADGDAGYGDEADDGADSGPDDYGEDEGAVVGDLVQSGLSRDQATAIVDAIRALAPGPVAPTGGDGID